VTIFLLAILLGTIGAGWVILPLVLRRWASMSDAVPIAVVEGEARRREALTALKEAEYDHAAGKLDADDYGELRSQLEVEALAALRAAPPSVSSSVSSGSMHSCGFTNPAGSRFCAGCGKRLD
jgi:hypothetical protein